MKPGDYIIQKYAKHEANIWIITGVYYGGLGHESVVGLMPINRKLTNVHGQIVEEMLVPLDLVEPYLCESRHV